MKSLINVPWSEIFRSQIILTFATSKTTDISITKYYSSFASWGIGLEDCSQHSATTVK